MGAIAAEQTSGTIKMEKAIHKIIDYCATHTDVTLQKKASGIVLKVHIDESYLSESKDRNRSEEFLYIGDATSNLIRPNGAIMLILSIIPNVIFWRWRQNVEYCSTMPNNWKHLGRP